MSFEIIGKRREKGRAGSLYRCCPGTETSDVAGAPIIAHAPWNRDGARWWVLGPRRLLEARIF